MDITKVIKDTIASVPDGEHQRSLLSIANHVDVAISHLHHGQTTKQTHLFTDAIYRCNQAYEGSIKEAYKVLTGNDPSKKTTSQIENYLEKNKTLRPRVLEQLRRYRREWQNPATHDHTEDFDENEAFLAIVNIVAFAKVCLDQIVQKFAFDQAQLASHQSKHKSTKSTADIAEISTIFAEQFFDDEVSHIDWIHDSPRESEIVAAFGGFLSVIPDAKVTVEKLIGTRHRADLYIESQTDSVILELKSAKSQNALGSSIVSLDNYLSVYDNSHGVIILYDLSENSYATYDIGETINGKRRLVVAPETINFGGIFKKLQLQASN